jgi:uncharacterized radical SAM superfamily Fe-S cluster-containing enzyme
MQTNYLLQHCKAKYFHHIVYFFSHGSENKQLLFHSTAAESNLDCWVCFVRLEDQILNSCYMKLVLQIVKIAVIIILQGSSAV